MHLNNGGEDGPRTHDLLNAIQTLSQTELQPHIADRLCVHDRITYWISNRISQNSYDLLSWWSTHSRVLNAALRSPIAVRITATIWCPRRDSNPHGQSHLILSQARLPIPSLGQITHSLVPKAPASVGSSYRTNSRAVFLNPQDWGVPTPTAGVPTTLRKGADNRTEIFFHIRSGKIISTKFLHYLSNLINIMSDLIFSICR